MVPRPIAVPYRIGVDICSVRRIRDLIINGPVGRRWQKEGETGIVAGIQRLVDRILTFDEQRAFWKTFVRVKRVPDRGNEGLNVFNPDPTHHLAGRWAAKEAIKKASSRRLTFADIMVLNESSGKPMGIILDKPAKMMQEVVLEKQSALGKGESARRVFGTRPSFPHMPPSHYWHLYDLKLSSSEKLYHDIEGQAVEVSISHEDEFAVASVILPNMLKSSEAPHESSVAMKPSEDHS